MWRMEVEFDGEDVGGVDEFADGVGCYCDVGSDEAFAVAYFNDFLAVAERACVGEFDDFAAVEDNGDEVFFAESFSSFFAEVGTGFGRELEYFHCLKCFVLLKIKICSLISHHTGC